MNKFDASSVAEKVRVSNTQENTAVEEKQDTFVTKETLKKETTTFDQKVAPRSPEMKAIDLIGAYLDTYKKENPGTKKRAETLLQITNSALRFPRKQILDTIINFLRENKNELFLDPINAFQGIEVLRKSDNLKVRVFFTTMQKIANNTANRKTVNIEAIRTIFANEDFVNWVAVKLEKRI